MDYTLKDSGDRRAFDSGAVRDMGGGKGRCDLLPLHEIAILVGEFHIDDKIMSEIIALDPTQVPCRILSQFDALRSSLKYAERICDTENINSSSDDRFDEIREQMVNSLYYILKCFLVYNYRPLAPDIGFDKPLYNSLENISADCESLIKMYTNCTLYSAILNLAKHFEAGAVKYGDDNWRKGIPINVYLDSAIRHFCKCMRGDTDEPHDNAFMWNVMCCIWTINHIGIIFSKNE